MMWYEYLLVFIGSFLVDVIPFPLPPAFTVMIALQIAYDLNIWAVIGMGVLGSIAGRYILTLYIPKLSDKIFSAAKNEDVHFLGQKLKQKGWKGPALVLVYSLLPLPTTPLFIAGGMARVKPLFIILPFIVGKLISDTIAVLMGKYAADNVGKLLEGMVSWKSITGLALGLTLIMALLFIDWRTLLKNGKFKLEFNIWNKRTSRKA
jgi:membrane protein YqaA with SNARE-associated domain